MFDAIFLSLSTYVSLLYMCLYFKMSGTVFFMYKRRADAINRLDSMLKARTRASLPKSRNVMNEVVVIPPILQFKSPEDVRTFLRLRHLLRKLGRQYKTRSALFIAQQLFCMFVFASVYIGLQNHTKMMLENSDRFNGSCLCKRFTQSIFSGVFYFMARNSITRRNWLQNISMPWKKKFARM